jgi:RNA polymerase sigma-70 factor (ECF subfamily)
MQCELVERAQRGDAEAFEALVNESGHRLYAIAYRILRDSDRAEDALQEALIEIWDDLPTLRDPERFEAWTYRLVVHASYRLAKQERRRIARVREILPGPGRPDDVSEVVDRDEIERLFRRLTPEHRAVLVLRHYVGLPVNRIAEVLEIPVGTAGSRLHYAERSLRAALDADARGGVAWRATL